jgi:hypothetical protein
VGLRVVNEGGWWGFGGPPTWSVFGATGIGGAPPCAPLYHRSTPLVAGARQGGRSVSWRRGVSARRGTTERVVGFVASRRIEAPRGASWRCGVSARRGTTGRGGRRGVSARRVTTERFLASRCLGVSRHHSALLGVVVSRRVEAPRSEERRRCPLGRPVLDATRTCGGSGRTGGLHRSQSLQIRSKWGGTRSPTNLRLAPSKPHQPPSFTTPKPHRAQEASLGSDASCGTREPRGIRTGARRSGAWATWRGHRSGP